MKRIYILLMSATAISAMNAQILTNGDSQSHLFDSNYFLDASNFQNQADASKGKLLGFPKADLTKFKFDLNAVTDDVVASGFDGVIVYNSVSGNIGENATGGYSASTMGQQVSVKPGFYYFSNPNGATNQTVSEGKWIRLSDSQAAAKAELWINDNSKKVTKLAKLSDGSTPRTDDKNIFITDDGKVGIGTKEPKTSLDVKGRYLRISGDGNEGAYIGGDSLEPFADAKTDVQLGSTTPGIKYVSLWNTSDSTPMNLNADELRINKMGIGTNNPTEKLHIKDGHIKIEDGTQQEGRVLTSDANGVGTWQALSMGNKMTKINFYNSNATIITTNYYIRKNTDDEYTKEVAEKVDSPFNEIGLTFDNEKINLKKGKYMVFMNHDISSAEYCNLRVMDNNQNNIIYSTFYGEWLNTSFPAIFSSDTSISFHIKCFADDSYDMSDMRARVAPNPAPLFYKSESAYKGTQIANKVTILKLN